MQVLEDPDVKNKSAQQSIINRMRSKELNDAHITEILSEKNYGVSFADKNFVEKSNRRAVQVLKTSSTPLPHSNYSKCVYIVVLIKKSYFCLVKTRNNSLTTIQLT